MDIAPTKLRVAAAQMASSTDPEDNLLTAVGLIRKAAAAGAQLVVFPEATIANFSVPIRCSAEPLEGSFASGIRNAAAEQNLVAVVGMFEPADDGRSYNTVLVTGRAGKKDVEASYRKVHLYDAFAGMESETVKPGDGYVTFDLDGVTIGVATCYDLRFAQQFNELGLMGAHVVCVSAAWADGQGKAEQWDLLTRARAMDSQAWLVACDQAWQPPLSQAPLSQAPLGVGRSAVIDPLGVVRARLSSGPDLLVTDIDLGLAEEVRRCVPVLRSMSRT